MDGETIYLNQSNIFPFYNLLSYVSNNSVQLSRRT